MENLCPTCGQITDSIHGGICMDCYMSQNKYAKSTESNEHKKVTCNGCFDGLHSGHLFFLGYSLAQGDELVVGINTDDYISRTKRPKPFYAQNQRKKMLLELGFIKKVVIFDEDNPISFIKSEDPQIHCTGAEYIKDCVEANTVKNIGAKLVFVPRIGSWSTSEADARKINT